MDAMLASLRLVYPPISNQEADWLLADKQARQLLDTSNIYMIGQREEVFFINVEGGSSDGLLNFTLRRGSQLVAGVLNFGDLAIAHGSDSAVEVGVEAGPKIIRVFELTVDGERTVVDWFTPDKLLFSFWRGFPFIALEKMARPLSTFELLYVGMSHGSSFKRLVAEPHHKRLKILTNELHIRHNARVSDELTFFFFKIDPLFVSQFDAASDFTDDAIEAFLDPSKRVEKMALITDAERAFIKVLQTKYNEIVYENYPRGEGGIYNSGLNRYGYVIAEDLTLLIGSVDVVGGYAVGLPNSNDADFIFIEGDKVELVDVSKQVKFHTSD